MSVKTFKYISAGFKINSISLGCMFLKCGMCTFCLLFCYSNIVVFSVRIFRNSIVGHEYFFRCYGTDIRKVHCKSSELGSWGQTHVYMYIWIYMYIYIYILHGSVCDSGFHGLYIHQLECLSDESVSMKPRVIGTTVLYIYIFFIIQCVKARAIPCPHQPPTKGDNTVLAAQGGTATPGATKQLLPPDRVLRELYIYIYIYIYTPDQLRAEPTLDVNLHF